MQHYFVFVLYDFGGFAIIDATTNILIYFNHNTLGYSLYLFHWCKYRAYQPPDGAHCPDCDVCIEGYDHHCPWMGTCIGKKNKKPFIIFNATWLLYLCYTFIWVIAIGPQT